MRAVRINQYGTADEMHCDAMPVPEPGPGEVLVRQYFAGVNFADVYMRNGLYHGEHTYGTQVPFTLGLEGVGIVEAVGAGVSSLEPEMRVGYCLARGGYAESTVVPADKVIRLPEWCPDDTAAALMLQGATSHYLTHSLFKLEPGHTCLIHAGAGGVGQLLIQIAKTRGAFVITTVGSQAKAELARSLGADQVILYRQQDVFDQVEQITDSVGVDVVYDSVGKDTIHTSLRCLKVRGTCALFGASSGPVEAITPMELAEAGSVFLTRPHLAHYRRTAGEAQWRADDLFELLHDGRLKVAIDSRYPLEGAAEAHRHLESRASSGKILLAI
jgi:NADPH2:quinone reductase